MIEGALDIEDDLFSILGVLFEVVAHQMYRV